MDYQKHYTLLIDRARVRRLEGYSEKHHIVPKCMGGHDDKDNIVRLTPEEHYLAHQLLVKMHPEVDGLVYATHVMYAMGGNKQFGWLKRKHAAMLSETRSGKDHPNYGKSGTMLGRKHTEEAKKKMRDGWSAGNRDVSKPKGKDSPNYGRKHTRESLQRMRKPKPEGFGERMKGENNPNYGKRASETSKSKMSERAKSRVKVQCPHCDKVGAVSQMKRWHFDNCKMRNQ